MWNWGFESCAQVTQLFFFLSNWELSTVCFTILKSSLVFKMWRNGVTVDKPLPVSDNNANSQLAGVGGERCLLKCRWKVVTDQLKEHEKKGEIQCIVKVWHRGLWHLVGWGSTNAAQLLVQPLQVCVCLWCCSCSIQIMCQDRSVCFCWLFSQQTEYLF